MKFVQQPEEILKGLGIFSPDDIDLDLVAFSLNAHVKRKRLSDCEGHIIGGRDKAIITINSDASQERQRFSLGHEIGHWINDRGNNLTYRCDANDMRQGSFVKGKPRQNKEVRANKFSAELLMPNYLFMKCLVDIQITGERVSLLASVFNVSRTSAAIRLVEVCNLPCMFICWKGNGTRRWFYKNNIVPECIWPHRSIPHPKEGFKLSNEIEVDADKWIDGDDAESHVVIESVFFDGYDFFSLIWWRDEGQLLDI